MNKPVSLPVVLGFTTLWLGLLPFGHAASPPLITAVNPFSGSQGTPVIVTGTGFSGATEVFFTDFPNGNVVDATYAVVNDTQITTSVPLGVGFQSPQWQWLVSVFTPMGGTVTIPYNYFNVTSQGFSGPGSSVYVVRNGGSLESGGGSSTVFIESGGSYTNEGGSNTVYVQSGATYIQPPGGAGNHVFYEPGATVSLPEGYGFYTEVPAVQESFLTASGTAIPEPGSWLAGVLTAGVLASWRFRAAPKIRS